jgi:hypothetical protein
MVMGLASTEPDSVSGGWWLGMPQSSGSTSRTGRGERRQGLLGPTDRRYRATADEPQGVRVAAGLTGGLLHGGDRHVEVAQVGTAGTDPAVGDPAGAAQGRFGTAAKQHWRMGALHRLGLHPGGGTW